MIVETMNHTEVYRELHADKENVDRWICRRLDECRRKALKLRQFPARWMMEYISPRRNRYIISILCTKRKAIGNTAVAIFALRREKHGHTVYMYKMNDTSKGMIFLPHFFERYSERTHIDKTGMELIRHFFSRIVAGYVIDKQNLAGKSVRYNGRDHLSMALEDGILLGDVEGKNFIVRTFITYDMAGNLQKSDFLHAKKQLPDVNEEMRMITTGKPL